MYVYALRRVTAELSGKCCGSHKKKKAQTALLKEGDKRAEQSMIDEGGNK